MMEITEEIRAWIKRNAGTTKLDRDAKNEMRELLTVRANVERILNEPMGQRDEATQKKQER